MSNNVILPSEFKIDNLSFLPVKKNSQGGQSVFLSYLNEDTGKSGPLLIQSPKMRMPFGGDAGILDGKKTNKFSVSVSLSNQESLNENLTKFTEIIKEIDNKAKKFARTDGAMEWFGKVHSEEMINELYKSAIKKSKNEKYPPTLKVKLPVKITSDKLIPQFDIYNDKKELINIIMENGELDINSFSKGGDFVGILQATGVWFVGSTSFGCAFKAVQVKVSPNQKLVGYQIIDDEELIEEDEEQVG